MENHQVLKSNPAVSLFHRTDLDAPLALKVIYEAESVSASLFADGSVEMNGVHYADIEAAMNAAPSCHPNKGDAWQFWTCYNNDHQDWRPLAQLRSTSQTDQSVTGTDSYPMRFHELAYPKGSGKVAMMSCPGRRSSESEDDNVSLGQDLATLERNGYATVISLVEAHEFTMLGVPKLSDAVNASNLIWIHLPIRDTHAPDELFEAKWRQIGPLLHRQLIAGSSIAFHCHNGLGRSSMATARLLIEAGAQPTHAIAKVLTCQPNAIESQHQESYLLKQHWNPIADLAQGA